MSRPYQIALAATLLVLALAIVGLWRIGPVVAELTATHGVHAGDGLAAVPGTAALWLVGRPLRLGRRERGAGVSGAVRRLVPGARTLRQQPGRPPGSPRLAARAA